MPTQPPTPFAAGGAFTTAAQLCAGGPGRGTKRRRLLPFWALSWVLALVGCSHESNTGNEGPRIDSNRSAPLSPATPAASNTTAALDSGLREPNAGKEANGTAHQTPTEAPPWGPFRGLDAGAISSDTSSTSNRDAASPTKSTGTVATEGGVADATSGSRPAPASSTDNHSTTAPSDSPSTDTPASDDPSDGDPLPGSEETSAQTTHEPCPSGYARASAATGCAPLLLDLQLSHGRLTTALRAGSTSYEIAIPVYIRQLTLTPWVPKSASVTIDGAALKRKQPAAGIGIPASIPTEPWTSEPLALGLSDLELVVSEPGKPATRYNLRVNRIKQPIAYVKASNTDSWDNFGRSLALAGDGNTLAIGAPNEDSSANGIGGTARDNAAADSGAAYVFLRRGSSWFQQAYIKAPNGSAYDKFGHSVAVSSDGNTLVVGAPREDGADSNAGAVYVFVREDETWQEQAYLHASNPESGDEFGTTVALSADGNILAVGAPKEDGSGRGLDADLTDNSASNAGAVYLFYRNEARWTKPLYIKSPSPSAYDGFGTTLALSGDGQQLAVGTPNADISTRSPDGTPRDEVLFDAGAVYLYARAANSASSVSIPSSGSETFPESFSMDAGLFNSDANLSGSDAERTSDGTGVTDTSVSLASATSGDGASAESAQDWFENGRLEAPRASESDEFGCALAFSADGSTLAIGACHEDLHLAPPQPDSSPQYVAVAGAVHIFSNHRRVWTHQIRLTAFNADEFDSFGSALTLSAEGETLAVGTYSESGGASGIDSNASDNTRGSAGAVYLFTKNGATWSRQSYVKAFNTAESARFGRQVSLSADGNSLAVGADGESSSATGVDGYGDFEEAAFAGAAYVYR